MRSDNKSITQRAGTESDAKRGLLKVAAFASKATAMRTVTESAASARSTLHGQQAPGVVVADARPRHGQRACNAATYGAGPLQRTMRAIALFRWMQRTWAAATRALRRPRVSAVERYLSKAVDHADLEHRMRYAHLFGADAWGR
jgi:hypothetical protein